MTQTPVQNRAFTHWRSWAAGFVLMLLASGVIFAFAGDSAKNEPLVANNPKSLGAKAVLEVLRDEGVAVTARSEVGQLDAKHEKTLVVFDPQYLQTNLDSDRLAAAKVRDLVLILPRSTHLADLELPVKGGAGSALGGTFRRLTAQCELADELAPTLRGELRYYEAEESATEVCYRPPLENADRTGAYLRHKHHGMTVHIVGTAGIFQNQQITNADNAAFALNVLSRNKHLTWVVSDPDTAPAEINEPESVLPGWVPPMICLLLGIGVFVWWWYGRRLGRVVWEQLPVVVNAAEAAYGLATLYRVAGAYQRAAQLHRNASMREIAHALKVPTSASGRQLLHAIEQHTSVTAQAAHNTLFGPVHNAADVDRLVTELAHLRATVHRATRPVQTTSATSSDVTS